MSNTRVKANTEGDQNALFEELKGRYGAKIATEIIEKVTQAVSDSKTPDYMPVKALSEMVELFRSEAQTLAKQLKIGRKSWIGSGSKVSSFEKRKLEMEFNRIYRLYWVSMKLFYPLYHRAIGGYQGEITRYGRSSETKMNIAA